MSKDTIHLFNNLAVKGVVANGFIGSSGQALLSNGTGVYWGSGAGFTGSKGDTGENGSFGGAAFDYTFSTATTLADPGDGVLKFNNTVFSSANTLIIHDNDDNGVSVYNFLQTIDDSTSAIKGHFTVTEKANTTNFAQFSIVGNHVDAANSFQVPVAYLTGAASMTNGLDIIITFARTGDKGDTGFTGSFGFTGSQGDIGYTGSRGATGFVGSTGYTGSQGDIGYTGSQGVIGFTGSTGFVGSASTVAGPVGYTGSQGIGYTGSQGTTGFVGSASTEVGPIGYTGSAGAGYTGSAGSNGYTGSQGAIGYTGSQGVIGFTGSKGDIGYTGSQGDGGPQGITGFTGSKGDIGYTGSAGPIGGSNTQVIFNDSGFANGSSSFIYDKVNARVGINVSTPVERLQLGGGNIYIPYSATNDSALLGVVSSDNFTTTGVVMPSYGLKWADASDIAGVTGFFSSYAGLRFFTNNVERIRVVANGNVGIGTTVPISKLHVSSAAGGLIVDYLGGNYYDSDTHYFRNYGATVTTYLIPGATSTLLSTNAALPLAFGTNNAERMRVAANGNVGVGTTTPATKFEVSTNTGVETFKVTQTDTTGGTLARMRISHGSGAEGTFSVGQGFGVIGMATSGPFVFTTTDIERMRITADGNLGVGTQSPGAKLGVSGEINILPDAYGLLTVGRYDAGFPWAIIRPDASATGMEFRNNAGDQVMSMVSSTKNVGIGTSSPAYKLVVSNAGAAGIEFDPATGIIQTYNRSTSAYTGMSLYASEQRFYTGSSPAERMRIAANGNIGIGTTSPAEKFQILVNTGTSGFESGSTLTNGVDANLFNYVTGTAATDKRALITVGAADQSLTFGTLYTERMRITAAGDVGIGTTTPSGYGKLAVIGNIASSTDGATVLTMRANAGATSLGSYNATGSYLAFQTNASGSGEAERMRITSGGYVGIGTTSPEAVLSVFNATTFNARTSGINVHRPSSYGQYGSFAYDGDTTYFSTTYTGGGAGVYGKFIFQAYDSTSTPAERMRIDASGNVGIGTNTPAARLHVSGAARIEHIGDKVIDFVRSGANTFSIEHDTSRMYFYNATTANTVLAFSNASDVGVGTANPAAKLHVIGNAIIGQNSNSSVAARLDITAGGSGYDSVIDLGYYGTFDAAIWHIKRHGADNTFRIAYAGGGGEIPAVIINSAGDVGIGSSPISRFDVREANRADSTNIGNLGVYTTTTQAAGVGGTIALGGLYTSVDYAPFGSVRGGKENSTNSNYAGYLAFQTIANGGVLTERMRIDSSGNVGIANLGQPIRGNLDISLGNISSAGVERSIHFGYSVVDYYGFKLSNINSPGSYGAGTFSIQRGTTTAWIDALLVNDSGNVGIGTTTPGYKLQVASGGGGDAEIVASNSASVERIHMFSRYSAGVSYLHSQNSNLYLGTFDNYQLMFFTNNSERMRITASGNVGIGTSSPAARLHVSGTGYIFNNANADPAGSVTIPNSAGTFITYNRSGGLVDTEIIYGNTVNSFFRITSQSAAGVLNERMRIDSSGNVGIGTTSPGYKLHVVGGIANTPVIARVEQGSSGNTFDYAAFGVTAPGTTGGFVAWATGSARANQVWIQSDGAYPLVLGTNDTERMRIDSSGNVGIGTTSPGAYKLNVNGQSYFSDTIWLGSGGYISWTTGYSDGVTQTFASATSGSVALIANGAVGLFVKSNQNVGVGTTAPGTKLDIGSTQGSGITLRYDSSTNYRALITPYWNTSTDTRIDFAINNTSGATPTVYMTVGYGGNVGIGTQTPGYKLEVNGSFAATTKSFVIDHPTKEGMRLRYGSLEGPENGVYVRGRLKDNNVIELPDYWTKLVDEDTITVNLTPIGKHQKLYVEDIKDNCVHVGNDNMLSKNINCFYIVYAERKDVEKLEVEIIK